MKKTQGLEQTCDGKGASVEVFSQRPESGKPTSGQKDSSQSSGRMGKKIERLVSMLNAEHRHRIDAEHSLVESERRYKMLVENINAITYIAKADGHNSLIYVSPQVESILGYSQEEYKSKPQIWLRNLYCEDRQRVLQEVRRARRSGSDFSCEYRMTGKDGRVVWFHNESRAVRNEDGEIIFVQGIMYDITERKKQEEKINADQERFRNLTRELLTSEEKLRRQIAATLHDSIVQILVFCKLELQTLIKQQSCKDKSALIQISDQITRAMEQSRTLTMDLSSPTLYTFGIEAAVEELAEEFSEKEDFDCVYRKCDSEVELSDHVKVVLYRSVRELLINAARHSEAKKVRIESGISQGGIEISVRDDGKGFDVSVIESHSHKAAGFGLFSIRQRLANLGGSFRIESDIGKGTQAVLWAPIEKGEIKDGQVKK